MNDDMSLSKWAEMVGVKAIRFFPSNPTVSTPNDILKAAHEAIKNLEAGRAVAFKDPIEKN